jgi:hypothetical protein
MKKMAEISLSKRLQNASQHLETSTAAPCWLKAVVRQAITLKILQLETIDEEQSPPDFMYPH